MRRGERRRNKEERIFHRDGYKMGEESEKGETREERKKK